MDLGLGVSEYGCPALAEWVVVKKHTTLLCRALKSGAETITVTVTTVVFVLISLLLLLLKFFFKIYS